MSRRRPSSTSQSTYEVSHQHHGRHHHQGLGYRPAPMEFDQINGVKGKGKGKGKNKGKFKEPPIKGEGKEQQRKVIYLQSLVTKVEKANKTRFNSKLTR
eukprot:5214112-Amphidinium_carterae.1